MAVVAKPGAALYARMAGMQHCYGPQCVPASLHLFICRQGSTLAALEQNYKTAQALLAAGQGGSQQQPQQQPAGIETFAAEGMDMSDGDEDMMGDGEADGMAVDGAAAAGGHKKGKVSRHTEPCLVFLSRNVCCACCRVWVERHMPIGAP